MELLTTILSFLLVIGVLVFVHELGHFLTAIWTGMRADVFALGMGPRMMGWNRRTGFTFGKLPDNLELGDDTDYRICWFPIGGYVKIVGMVDESFDTDFKDRAPEHYEFRSKKNWQKALVLVAGVAMNILFAIGVFTMMSYVYGEDRLATTSVSHVEKSSPFQRAGLEAGDKIVAIDGQGVTTWNEITERLADAAQDVVTISVVGSKGARNITVNSADLHSHLSTGMGLGIIPSGMKTVVAGVISGRPAEKAGLEPGDVILAVDSVSINATRQLTQYVNAHPGKQVTLHIERKDSVRPIVVTVGNDGLIGIETGAKYDGPMHHTTFGLAQSFSRSFSDVGSTVVMIGRSVAMVFQGTVSVKQSFGGPLQIAKMAERSRELGMEPFLRFMGLISISLAVMNLLPLPGLDGGHLVFVGIESIIRREIPTMVKIRFQQVGMALLLALMAFVLYLDITR
ncbi:MAG TPA: RIP metalloprotease RseP [Bacteroidetes bacterium]|nr:RIP metalloprotease RseP [Bacteroidota bacterium]HRK03551.1 RIP metalloprotease RseP [Chlorobiota bacterium]